HRQVYIIIFERYQRLRVELNSSLMRRKTLVAILLACTFTFSQAQISTSDTPSPSDPDNLAKDYFSQIMGVAASATTDTKLYQFIYEWIGTPYRLGGTTKKGVDCSKFAYELYENVFNTTLGQNSRNIYTQVDPVKKDQLEPEIGRASCRERG